MTDQKRKNSAVERAVKCGCTAASDGVEKRVFRGARDRQSALKYPNTSAMKRLVMGPASATFTAPVRGFFKLLGLYGTGFAPAKKNPVVKKSTSGIKTT